LFGLSLRVLYKGALLYIIFKGSFLFLHFLFKHFYFHICFSVFFLKLQKLLLHFNSLFIKQLMISLSKNWRTHFPWHGVILKHASFWWLKGSIIFLESIWCSKISLLSQIQSCYLWTLLLGALCSFCHLVSIGGKWSFIVINQLDAWISYCWCYISTRADLVKLLLVSDKVDLSWLTKQRRVHLGLV
jgi:hypothetical protein